MTPLRWIIEWLLVVVFAIAFAHMVIWLSMLDGATPPVWLRGAFGGSVGAVLFVWWHLKRGHKVWGGRDA